MKKNTKKKVFTLMLVIMLLSIAIVGGSLAWFTAEDEVTNTFTVGSIKIEQNETDKEGNPFVQDQLMLPIVDSINYTEDENYIEKVVTLTNTGDNEAYVRTHIAYPAALSRYITLDMAMNTHWAYEANYFVEIDNIEYTVSTFRYNKAFVPGLKTEPLLNGVYMNPNVDVQVDPNKQDLGPQFCLYNDVSKTYDYSGFAYTNEIKILVLTQAVQAKGFSTYGDALDRTFGTPSQTNNPFVN